LYASAHDPATFQGDVFVSTDGGGHWDPTGLGSDPKALSVDPTQPDVLYAGASRSVNGGQTWLPLTFDDPCDCGTPTGFAVDPTDHLTVYASLDQGLIYKGSVQRSTDGGASWTEVLSTDPVKSLAIDQTDPARVYAGTGQYAPGKVIKTVDGGDNWAASTSGLPASEIQALAVHRAGRGSRQPFHRLRGARRPLRRM